MTLQDNPVYLPVQRNADVGDVYPWISLTSFDMLLECWIVSAKR
jgi:hypothetical protein